ncbi:hypothetical protein SASPL_114841 [Salvia splendens]|uniref:Uncharacterized protein n=1 Tax=Salvia splendens TaxID=180675 RepID=A0A8X9A129_SALSN|nr:hypothetical protein SASPL_114841 [Salvia splendens]
MPAITPAESFFFFGLAFPHELRGSQQSELLKKDDLGFFERELGIEPVRLLLETVPNRVKLAKPGEIGPEKLFSARLSRTSEVREKRVWGSSPVKKLCCRIWGELAGEAHSGEVELDDGGVVGGAVDDEPAQGVGAGEVPEEDAAAHGGAVGVSIEINGEKWLRRKIDFHDFYLCTRFEGQHCCWDGRCSDVIRHIYGLASAPFVHLKKSRRETIPEKVTAEAEEFALGW